MVKDPCEPAGKDAAIGFSFGQCFERLLAAASEFSEGLADLIDCLCGAHDGGNSIGSFGRKPKELCLSSRSA